MYIYLDSLQWFTVARWFRPSSVGGERDAQGDQRETEVGRAENHREQ